MKAEADEVFQAFKTDQLASTAPIARHGIDKLGIERKLWKATIARRSATRTSTTSTRRRRVGATHLRPSLPRRLGQRSNEHNPTSVGHLWSHELDHLNFKWENELFCGLPEE
jgi:hypothetical protein